MESREGEGGGGVRRADAGQGDTGRVAGLDSLRGVAILLVILFHTSIPFTSHVPGQRYLDVVENQGVQLFFLVSAYTMCVMWRSRSGEAQPALKFYIRRVCRIAPLYWLAIVAYGVMKGFQPWPWTLANALLVHGVVPPAINSVVPGGWSIGVEIGFYLLFPLVVLIPAALLPLAAFAWFLVGGVGLSALLIAGGVDGTTVYYLPLTQFPVFLCGMYVFHLVRGTEGARPIANLALLGFWIGLAVLLRDLDLLGRPAFWAGIFLLSAAVWAVVRFNLRLAPLQFFGRLSYSMYLTHFAVISVVERVAPGLSYLLAVPAVVALTAALSWVSFRTGEKWSQDLGRHLVRRVGRGGSAGQPAATRGT